MDCHHQASCQRRAIPETGWDAGRHGRANPERRESCPPATRVCVLGAPWLASAEAGWPESRQRPSDGVGEGLKMALHQASRSWSMPSGSKLARALSHPSAAPSRAPPSAAKWCEGGARAHKAPPPPRPPPVHLGKGGGLGVAEDMPPPYVCARTMPVPSAAGTAQGVSVQGGGGPPLRDNQA